MKTNHDPDQSGKTVRKPRKGLLARLARDRKGSVAIEFAMLIIPFSMLVFAILESSLSFAAQQVLANATDDLARQLRTGQLKAAAVNSDIVFDRICDKLSIIVANDCPELEIDLKEYATFEAAAAVTIPYTSDNDIDTSSFSVTPGLAQSRNMIRTFYRWPVITDFMRASMSNMKGNKTLLFATNTWQNEPFDD
ncbi:MAG: TadE/TadG family type IV pilus assembly protein [Rhizobiaceae bacterium]